MNVKDRRENVLAIWDQKLKAAKTQDERESIKKAQKRLPPFIHLTRAQRSQLYEDALNLVGGHKQLYRKMFVHSDKGLIVMDRDLETEKNIERQFADYQNQGHPWGQLEFVMDAPFFVDSMKFPGIQLGDVCAYALRRYLDKGAIVGSHEEKQFSRIFQQFDRDVGKLHGLRHYTQGGKCVCMVCKERGHS